MANRVPTTGASEISRKDFESSIERKIDYVVPADAKVVIQAAKLGKTVAEIGKGTKLGAVLADIAVRLVATGDEAATNAIGNEAKTKSSLLGKLGSFKSMMPGKSKPKDKADKG